MSEVYYTSELLILCSSSVEPFSFGSLLDLLDTTGLLAKHTLSLHHDRTNTDYMLAYLADHELLYFYTLIHAVRLKTQTLMEGPAVGLRHPEL